MHRAYQHLNEISQAICGYEAEADETPLGAIACALFESMLKYVESVCEVSEKQYGKQNEDRYYEIADAFVRQILKSEDAADYQTFLDILNAESGAGKKR